MKIEPGQVYKLRTSDDWYAFLEDCEEQGFLWATGDLPTHNLQTAALAIHRGYNCLAGKELAIRGTDVPATIEYRRTRMTVCIEPSHIYWCGSEQSARSFLQECASLGYYAGDKYDDEENLCEIGSEGDGLQYVFYNEYTCYMVQKAEYCNKTVVTLRNLDIAEPEACGWMAPIELDEPLKGYADYLVNGISDQTP